MSLNRTMAAETPEKIGETIKLDGWVNTQRDHGKIAFFDLRDRSGLVQVVALGDMLEAARDLRPEDVVEVEGVIVERKEGTQNSEMPTGAVEVKAKSIKVINKAETPPFDVLSDGRDIDEVLRLQYRYLDLRRPRLKKNLDLRHKMIKFMRDYLDERGFAEIETPIITKATPEGARDFLVPSRMQPGCFYALPQSPQQYKQILMVAGFEKYYQIARCFRDEDPRADRAYGEFSQLDMEMSFMSQDEILNLVEGLMIDLAEKVFGKKIYKKPFPRFSYADAIKYFGDDKFDLRRYNEVDGRWELKENSDEIDPDVLAFAWVVDFPLFEKTETRTLAPSHHPFTAPKPEDVPLLETDPLKVHSLQHDLVCNGYEVGGGSVRITDPKIQKNIFEILGHTPEDIEQKFGHLLKAFSYGVPPHGGIAPGIERLLMVFTGEANTREVMAFPMLANGRTAVMNAPSPVEEKQLKEVGILKVAQ